MRTRPDACLSGELFITGSEREIGAGQRPPSGSQSSLSRGPFPVCARSAQETALHPGPVLVTSLKAPESGHIYVPHTHICTQSHTHTHSDTHTHTITHTHIHSHTHACTHTHTHTHLYTITHTHTHKHTYTLMLIHTHTLSHSCSYTHSNTHSHTHS